MPETLNRILYVEDDSDIRVVAQMALQTVGRFTVIACASGRDALKAAPQARADLLLLDVMMPGMDGPNTLKALGALDVIHKPFDPMELSAQIRRILAAQV